MLKQMIFNVAYILLHDVVVMNNQNVTVKIMLAASIRNLSI